MAKPKDYERALGKFDKSLKSIERRREKFLEQLKDEEDDVRSILLMNNLKQLRDEALRLVTKERARLHAKVDFEMDSLHNKFMHSF
jgi:hypothetical protein